MLFVIKHFATNIADIHNITIGIDSNMYLGLLIPIPGDSYVVIGLDVSAVAVKAHLHLLPLGRFGEVLRTMRTMRTMRIAPIRHGSVLVHSIMSVTRAIGLANATEVDVGVTV